LIDAELQLRFNEAVAAEASKNRFATIENFSNTREKLRVLHADYDPRAALLKQADLLRPELWGTINFLSEQVSAWHAAKPAVCAYLPDDPQCQQWKDELQVREQRLEAAKEKLRELPGDGERFELVKLGQEIERLSYVEKNLLNSLNGSLGKWPESTISGVL
jgi:hypothetical protein